MAFALTYQDYLNSLGSGAYGGSEGGQGVFSGLSQSQWNDLSDADKWKQVGAVMMAPTDPRYADIAGGLKPAGDNPRLDGLLSISPGSYKPGMLTDSKNLADLGNGVNATYWGNFSPMGQRDDTSANWLHDMRPGLLIAAALLSGGAAAGAMGAAGGAGGAAGVSGSSALATGGFGTDIAAGSGTFGGAAGAAGTAGAAGNGGYWNMVADNSGTTDVPIGEDPYNGYVGGLDPETASGQYGGMGVAQNGIGPGSYGDILQGTINNPGSLVDRAGGLLGNAGDWAMSHPLQAAGLLQTGYGLVHKPSHPGSSNGGTKGGNGNGPAGNFSVPQQHFYVNPYIAAQIQRGYGI